jgi:putative NADH-flavin reductase
MSIAANPQRPLSFGMNIVIFGSTGPSGRLIVEQALAQGHTVTAFARNPAGLPIQHEKLTVAQGDILDLAAVERAVSGKDAVLSALGIRKLGKNTILSDGTRNIIAAMQKLGVKRFICMTSLGVGDSKGQTAWVFDRIIQPFILHNVFADKEVQERLVRESNLDWIIVRPAGLTNGPRTGVYQHWAGKPSGSTKSRISRADVAEFMLKQLTDDTYLRKTPGLSY